MRDNLDMEHSAHSAGQSEEFCTWAGRQSVKLTIHHTAGSAFCNAAGQSVKLTIDNLPYLYSV